MYERVGAYECVFSQHESSLIEGVNLYCCTEDPWYKRKRHEWIRAGTSQSVQGHQSADTLFRWRNVRVGIDAGGYVRCGVPQLGLRALAKKVEAVFFCLLRWR